MHEAQPSPLVYTAANLTRMFCITQRTLQRWVADGRIPAPMLPGRWDRVVIDRWWNDKTRQTATIHDICDSSDTKLLEMLDPSYTIATDAPRKH